MRNALLLISFFFIIYPTLSLADKLDQTCSLLGGKISEQITCPNSEKVRNGRFCVFIDKPIYFNGCTKSFGDYGNIFYSACLKHDLCYHHEPATNGYNRNECDTQFYDNLNIICKSKTSLFKFCDKAAWIFYQSVRAGGLSSWQCSNIKFEYDNIFARIN